MIKSNGLGDLCSRNAQISTMVHLSDDDEHAKMYHFSVSRRSGESSAHPNKTFSKLKIYYSPKNHGFWDIISGAPYPKYFVSNR